MQIFQAGNKLNATYSCGSFTWSGNVVSLSSRSSSAYVKIVFKERRKNSSLKFWDVPTRDERDIVTCIFTLAKFCNRETVFQQPANTVHSLLSVPGPTVSESLQFCCSALVSTLWQTGTWVRAKYQLEELKLRTFLTLWSTCELVKLRSN